MPCQPLKKARLIRSTPARPTGAKGLWSQAWKKRWYATALKIDW